MEKTRRERLRRNTVEEINALASYRWKSPAASRPWWKTPRRCLRPRYSSALASWGWNRHRPKDFFPSGPGFGQPHLRKRHSHGDK